MGRELNRALSGTLMTAALMLGSAARADETVTYNYDERGRLVQVSRTGTVNNGVQATYNYDKADNRTQVNVTGAGGTPPPPSLPQR